MGKTLEIMTAGAQRPSGQIGFFAEFRDGKGAGASAKRERLQIALAPSEARGR